jgi:hypothetical protein
MTALSMGQPDVSTTHFKEMSRFYHHRLEREVWQQDSADARLLPVDQTEGHVCSGADGFHTFFGTAPVTDLVAHPFATVRTSMPNADIE